MKELRLFLRKIDQKVISKGKHYLLTLIILYRYKTNEVLDHYKEQTPQKEEPIGANISNMGVLVARRKEDARHSKSMLFLHMPACRQPPRNPDNREKFSGICNNARLYHAEIVQTRNDNHAFFRLAKNEFIKTAWRPMAG